MHACEHCRENLFDLVFDLLDEDAAHNLREHLKACPPCQAELEKVQSQQKLLARAARAVDAVPEFVAPGETTVAPPPAEPAESAVPPKRRRRRGVWLALGATAAAIAVSVGALSYSHQRAMDDLSSIVAAKRAELRKVDDRLAALPAKYASLHKEAVAKHRSTTPPHLHVTGPMQLEPGAKASVRVSLQGVDGEPTRGKVRVQLVEEATRQVISEGRADCEGQGRVEVDAAGAKPGSRLAVVVEADTPAGRAGVQEVVQVAAPTFVTRIDTNKAVYEVNEVLFFRVLLLDRWSLKPPPTPVALQVKLLGPKGETVAELKQTTEAGGVLAGELPIRAELASGEYRLDINADGNESVQAVSHRLQVMGEAPTPDIALSQPRYQPGDMVRGKVFVPGGVPMLEKASASVGGQSVPVTIAPASPPMLARGGATPGGQGKTEAKKMTLVNPSTPKPLPPITQVAPNNAGPAAPLQGLEFSAPLPKDLPPGATQVPFKLELGTGDARKAYNAVVPLAPSDYAVDLFPEGGDLVAGVPNRVFFRVRTRTGEPVTGDGRVILLSSKHEIVDAAYQQGLGALEFTPELKETYTIRVTSPIKTSEAPLPFAKLGIRSSGVVLHVPQAVGKQGEPIEMTLRNQGPTRKLLLVAHCRGQVVDQQWVDVKAGALACKLEPAEDVHGMVRVTAYEASGDTLTPVAERLVYRTSNARLDLAATLSTQQFTPGQAVVARLRASDEAGQPTPAWMLAAVVDERFQPRPRGLAAYFLLLNELSTRPGLEDAQVVLHDTPESVPTLERFLGAYGWRRFVGAAETARGQASPLIFSRENLPLETLQKQQEDQREAVLAPLRVAAFTEQASLEGEQSDAARAVRFAMAELERVQARPEPLRVALGLLFVALFLASLVLIGVALFRMGRQHASATPAFAGAFGCLAVCLAMMFVGQALGPPTRPAQTREAADAKDRPGPVALDRQLAQGTTRRPRPSTLPVGTLGLPALAAERQAPGIAKADRGPPRDGVEWQRTDLMHHLGAHTRREVLAFGANAMRGNMPNDAMQDRFRELEKATKADAKGAPPRAKIAPVAQQEAGRPDGREYAPRHAPGAFADTLLWSPVLWLPDGAGEVRFHIASGQATYRLLLLGHTPSGHLGAWETRLDVPAMHR